MFATNPEFKINCLLIITYKTINGQGIFENGCIVNNDY